MREDVLGDVKKKSIVGRKYKERIDRTKALCHKGNVEKAPLNTLPKEQPPSASA